MLKTQIINPMKAEFRMSANIYDVPDVLIGLGCGVIGGSINSINAFIIQELLKVVSAIMCKTIISSKQKRAFSPIPFTVL